MSLITKISWQLVEDGVEALVGKLRRLPGLNDYTLAYQPRGGMIPAVLLSHQLGLPVADASAIKIQTHPLIYVDDIFDSGATWRKQMARWQDPSPKDVISAFLFFRNPPKKTQAGLRFGIELLTTDWVQFPWEKNSVETQR